IPSSPTRPTTTGYAIKSNSTNNHRLCYQVQHDQQPPAMPSSPTRPTTTGYAIKSNTTNNHRLCHQVQHNQQSPAMPSSPARHNDSVVTAICRACAPQEHCHGHPSSPRQMTSYCTPVS
ncbi:hypothetical protein LSAT2_006161, partial [Lamellibrachia satsuma]